MDQNSLFEIGLGLTAPWKVVRSGLEECNGLKKVLCVDVDFETGSKFAWSNCGLPCPVHDGELKRWRHTNFWQRSTYLSARIECPEHKVKQVEVPRALAQSGFTLMFEALVMALARRCRFP